MQGGHPAYDQSFHDGLNIIRGENGSGKSTITDFIFYVLGGEFEKWKTVAGNCDEVQAEIETPHGTITLSRPIDRAQTPIRVFFGEMSEAQSHGLDGWERLPIRRSDSSRSFSQVLFGACDIPEAKSQGASNITMHQILRLLYSDQRTPASFLFRFESFDNREIREAVGDLLCGLSVYEIYEIELAIRDLEKKYNEVASRFSSVLESLPREEALTTIATLEALVSSLVTEIDNLNAEIAHVDDIVPDDDVKAFDAARGQAAENVRAVRDRLTRSEEQAHVLQHEINDLVGFVAYLSELADKLGKTEKSADVVGSIDFTHCPACLQPLLDDHGHEACTLCGAAKDPAQEQSKYLQIRLDLDLQLRESSHLMVEKKGALSAAVSDARKLKADYQTGVSNYAVRFEQSTSPRESYLAQRYQRLGQIGAELNGLGRVRERIIELEKLGVEKAEVQQEIDRRKDRLEALNVFSSGRRAKALSEASDAGKWLLRQDLDRQAEFKSVQSFALKFGDNAILVDGELNFAESSNVIVKNAAILSLLLATCSDREFNHPKFLILDNIEDKGMEETRSHNFQLLIASTSKELKVRHQIIMTTSKIAPSLDVKEYVIGPSYTHSRRTLDIKTEFPSRAP